MISKKEQTLLRAQQTSDEPPGLNVWGKYLVYMRYNNTKLKAQSANFNQHYTLSAQFVDKMPLKALKGDSNNLGKTSMTKCAPVQLIKPWQETTKVYKF